MVDVSVYQIIALMAAWFGLRWAGRILFIVLVKKLFLKGFKMPKLPVEEVLNGQQQANG